MKKLLALLLSAVAISNAAAVQDLTIISAGSRTGSLSMQAIAYANDLKLNYNVKLSVPGNFCEALSSLDDRQPTLFLWAHDFEAEVRAGKCSTNKNLSAATPIRFSKSASLICTMKKENNILKGAAKIGHTVPKKMFNNVINNINQGLGTNHHGVMYNGSGQVRLALVNGEIDFGLVTNEHAEFIRSKGGVCEYVLDDSTSIPNTKILQPLNPKIRMVHSFDLMFYTVNMSKQEIALLVDYLKKAHKNCSSAIGTYTQCDKLIDGTWVINKEILDRWEKDVSDAAE